MSNPVQDADHPVGTVAGAAIGGALGAQAGNDVAKEV